jgi:hypothetical protein
MNMPVNFSINTSSGGASTHPTYVGCHAQSVAEARESGRSSVASGGGCGCEDVWKLDAGEYSISREIPAETILSWGDVNKASSARNRSTFLVSYVAG